MGKSEGTFQPIARRLTAGDSPKSLDTAAHGASDPGQPPASETVAESVTIAAIETPNWVTETPPNAAYILSMIDSVGGSIQDIELTGFEFTALKEHLAEIRGYQPSRRARRAATG